MDRGVRHLAWPVTRAIRSRVEWSLGSPTIAVRPAVGFDDRAFGHGVHCVVRPLAVHVGLQRLEQRPDGEFREQHDVVHAAQRGNQFRAAGAVQDGSPGSLERAHRGVVVQRHHQHVGFLRRAFQVAHVAHVQQIEAAVGQGHRAPLRACVGHRAGQRVARHTLPTRTSGPGPPAGRCRAAACRVGPDRVPQLASRHRGGAALHHHQAAGVVGQARGQSRSWRRRRAPASSSPSPCRRRRSRRQSRRCRRSGCAAWARRAGTAPSRGCRG